MRIAFVVNGDEASPMGCRARAFADRLRGRYEVCTLYRTGGKLRALVRFVAGLVLLRPRVCYVFDMAFAGVAAGLLYRCLGGSRLVVETGDAITALGRAMGRGPIPLALTWGLEEISLRGADTLVVRGSFHKEWLGRRGFRSELIPDGVDTGQFTHDSVDDLRRQLGLDGVLTVGLVGSSIWSERRQSCYGWDLVEVIRLLKDHPVTGILIGGGSGIAVLRERCRRYGIEDRVRFLGPVPYDQLPGYLNLMDVCLSTQTNDRVGQVRTTGKLPLYLACGRYVLASRVGEAARVLPDEMLVNYEGTHDERYPCRLVERLLPLLADRAELARGRQNVALARARFDYGVLAGRVHGVIDGVVAAARRCDAPLRGIAEGSRR